MSQIEKLIGTIFIGDKLQYLEKINSNKDTVRAEKKEAIKKITKKIEVTESQFNEQKKFINKLEKLALKLNNTFQVNVNRYNIFKSIPHMIVVYDHKFVILDYNDAFIEQFCLEGRPCDSSIFIDIDNKEKFDVEKNHILVYGKLIEYETEYKCFIDGQKYIVTTTPIYDNREKFDFFVKIFTKI